MKKHQSTIYSVYLCMLQQTVDSVMSKLNVYVCYNRTWIQSCPSSTFMCATTERGFSHVQAQRLCVLQQNVDSVMSKLNVYVCYNRTWIQSCPSSTFMCDTSERGFSHVQAQRLWICIFVFSVHVQFTAYDSPLSSLNLSFSMSCVP
jgi:galactitol-specific phosphotransferase system IIB component